MTNAYQKGIRFFYFTCSKNRNGMLSKKNEYICAIKPVWEQKAIHFSFLHTHPFLHKQNHYQVPHPKPHPQNTHPKHTPPQKPHGCKLRTFKKNIVLSDLKILQDILATKIPGGNITRNNNNNNNNNNNKP